MDEAVNYASNGTFETYSKLIESFVADCKKYSGDKFLKTYCGIDLSNKDTGAITGWDAGGLVVKTAESIIEENGDLQSYRRNSLESFTLPHEKSGLSLIWSEPDNTTDAQRKIVQGLYSWWFKGALDLVTESYGLDFKNATVKKIKLDFGYVEGLNPTEEQREMIARWLAAVIDLPLNEKITSELILWINDKDNYPSVDLTNNKNGNSKSKKSSEYLDSTLAHEMTHGIMAANINYFDSLPTLIKEGMAELTAGADARDIKRLLEVIRNSRNSNDNLVNIFSNDTLEQSITSVKSVNYAAGYTLLRYFAKQASTVPEGVHCDSDKTKIVLATDYKDTKFKAEEYFTTIKEIDGSSLKSKIEIVGNELANTINGGTKNDTLSGGGGADKIYGKGGNDSIVGETAKIYSAETVEATR